MYLDALKIFKIFANEDPKTYMFNVSEVKNNIGNFFMISGDLEKAESYLSKALKADPSNSEILYSIASLESLRNNQIRALELLTKVLELDNSYVERVNIDERFDNIRNLKEFKDLIS